MLFCSYFAYNSAKARDRDRERERWKANSTNKFAFSIVLNRDRYYVD